MSSAANQKAANNESNDHVYEGLTLTQLEPAFSTCQTFDVHNRDGRRCQSIVTTERQTDGKDH
jgi:hypothetical protein